MLNRTGQDFQDKVIESLPKAYARHRIITDGDGKPADIVFLQVNKAFEKITGLARETVIDRRITEVLPDAENDADLVETLGNIACGESVTVEQYSPTFARWYEVMAYSDEPGYVAAVFEDITERKEAFDALERQNKKMALLLEVCSTIAEDKESGALPQVIVDGLAKLTDVKTAAIYLIQDNSLRLEAAYPPLPDDFPESLRIAEIADHPHIAEAISSKKPVVLADTKEAELSAAEQEVTQIRNLRSVLYVPLLYQNECLGVMIPSSVDEVLVFTEEIIELCQILSGQAALSIIEARRNAERDRYIQEIEQKNRDLETAEQTVRRSEKRLSDILRYAETVAFVTTDADTSAPRILDFSPGAEWIFGYAKEEVLGEKVEILHTEEDVEKFPQMLEAMARGQRGFSGETELVRKNGERFPALFKSHPMFDENGNLRGTIGVSFDITDRKQAEEEKDSLQKQLAQSQKMEAVGQLAGGIAHDFNNMLNVILGYSDMLIEELSENHPAVNELREIHGAAERSAGLTRQLLAFARQQTVEPKLVDLNETIQSLLGMLHRLIGEDIELLWRPAAEIQKVFIDPSQIDQVLINLCVNAREAVTDTGRIIIETSRASLGENYFKTRLEGASGEYTMIAVSDDGCGMDSELLSHIMEPFFTFTTKESGKGTGLGLSTVFGIVKQNNGMINVYSEPGEGTTVKIYLPAAEDQRREKPKKRAQAPREQGSEKILLADDDEMVRKLTGEMLKQLGYTVEAAASPQDALEICREHSDISLLITDVVMPEMNGKKLFETLQAELPHLQCLYMSGYTSNVVVHRGIVDEGIGFLQKPFSKNDLSVKIREVLDS